MKNIVIAVIGLGMLFLVQGCVSASEYRNTSTAIKNCSAFKMAALSADTSKETKHEARVEYKNCLEAESRRIADEVNWCIGSRILTSPLLLFIPLFTWPLCYYIPV